MAVFTAVFEPVESRVRLSLTGATGATKATFYSRVQGTVNFDVVRAGFEVPVTAGDTPAIFDYEFPAGSPATATTEYKVVIDVPSPGSTLTEDFEDATYAFTIDTLSGQWARSTVSADTGTWSLKASAIGNNANARTLVTVPNGVDRLNFSYRVSSEAGFDFFDVTYDGNVVVSASGNSGWLSAGPFSVTPGGIVTFRYRKDGATVANLDTAFIDNIVFSNSSSTSEFFALVDVSIEDQAWLKFPGFPYLNRPLTLTDRSAITRGSRGSLVPVVNTRAPVAVQEFMSARSLSLVAKTSSWTDYEALDAALGIGGVLFLHCDSAAAGLPSMYAVADSVESATSPRARSEARYTTIGLTEVTKPGYAYSGTLGTWQTLLSGHVTWQSVLDSYVTWSEILEVEGVPADVVVG